MRPTRIEDADGAAFARAVRAVASLEVVDMAFAASLRSRSGTFRLGQMSGHRDGAMDGLVSRAGQGLGGQVLALDRPLAVADYAAAPGITHEFDHAVAAEGLRAVFAVPLRLDGELRGAVYGAVRRPVELGERFLHGVVDAVRGATRPPPKDDPGPARRPVVLDPAEVRELHAVLRSARATATDPTLLLRLDRLARRLQARPDRRHDHRPDVPVHLAARELDVLALVALGCPNAEIARHLSLTVQTVKSYLKSAMAKLDSHTRAEAVHRARSAGLMP